MLRRVRRAIQIALRVSNCAEVYRHILLGHPLSRLCLRDGLVLQAPASVNLWNHFNAIWLQQEYTRGRFEIGAGATVVDVGANIGLFSIMAARTAARVFSYEPSEPTFVWLERNIHANGLKQIRAFNQAVGSVAGTRVLHTRSESTANSLYADQERGGGPQVSVQCITLAGIIESNRLSHVDFLKLDCEGSEFEIIFNTPREWLCRCDVISMECHDGVTGYSCKDVKKYLETAGYLTVIGRTCGNTTILRACKSGGRASS